jgi:hypothetical protein
MRINIYDDEMGTIHDKKCGLKQKPKVCIDYNDAMRESDISDHHLWCTVQREKGRRNISSYATS